MTGEPVVGIDWRTALLSVVEAKPPKSPFRFKQLHALYLTTGLALHSVPFSRLLFLSSSLDDCCLSYSASLLLCSPLPPSAFLSNTLTSALASSGRLLAALSLLPILSPNPYTFPPLLKACASSPPLLPAGLALHARLLKLLSPPLDPVLLTSLVVLHSRRGSPCTSRHIFDQILLPDLPAWNALLSSYARAGDLSSSADILSLFRTLQLSPVHPDQITLRSLLAACANLCALAQGAWAHAYIQSRHIPLNRFLGAALITMYSNAGRLDLARQMFNILPPAEKDTFCCNAMMQGLADHGDGRGALALFEEIVKEGVRPDNVTFLAVMSACAHAGLVEEGRRCFHRMEVGFNMLPRAEHFGCLVDLLGRAGKIEEAEKVVRRMPVEPNATIFRALLGACRIHSRLQKGEEVLAKLMELEPDYGGNYVLLSNYLADFGEWEGAVMTRKVMKERGIGKRAGLSIVEVDGVDEEFAMGDQNHPHTEEIYDVLDQISRSFLTNEVFDVKEKDYLHN